MTTIIFRQDKKKNPNCDSSIDSNGPIIRLKVGASFAVRQNLDRLRAANVEVKLERAQGGCLGTESR